MEIICVDAFCHKTKVPKLKVIRYIEEDGKNTELVERIKNGRDFAKRVMLTDKDLAYLVSLPKFKMFSGCFNAVIKQNKTRELEMILIKKGKNE